MRKSLNIRVLVFACIFSKICFGQNGLDTSSFGAGINTSTGIQITNQYMPYGNKYVASTFLNIGANFIFSTIAFEIGIKYNPYSYSKSLSIIDTTIQEIRVNQHYLNLYLIFSPKIFQRNKNLLSMSAGLIFSNNLFCGTDTIRNDGTHGVNNNVSIEKRMGLSVQLGFKYAYLIGKKSIFYAEPVFSFKPLNEFVYHDNSPNGKFADPTIAYTFGLNIGFQWVLTKKLPKYYIQRTKTLK